MPDDNQDRIGELLSAELRGNLIALLRNRLAAGEPMIAPVQFQKAMEEDYQAMSGVFPSDPIEAQLAEIFIEVVKAIPEVLIVSGFEKWITRSGLGTVRKNGWNIADTQVEGQNILRQDQVQGVLSQFDMKPADLNIRRYWRNGLIVSRRSIWVWH